MIIWIKVPCVDDVGSCSYASWCDVCKTCVCPLKSVSYFFKKQNNLRIYSFRENNI